MQRKASFLSVDKWQSKCTDVNDLAERLYDLGLVLGALLEKTDRATSDMNALTDKTDKSFNLYAGIGVAKSLLSLDKELDEWHSDLEKEFGPLCWVVADHDPVAPMPEGIFEFRDLRMAIFVSTFWTVKLVLSDAIQQMCTGLYREEDKGLPLDMQHSLKFLGPTQSRHSPTYRRRLTIDVIRATPYCLGLTWDNLDSPEIVTGLGAAQRSLFSLGIAMGVIFRFELGIEYVRGAFLFAYLMDRVSFAQHLHDKFKNTAGATMPDPYDILRKLREEPSFQSPSEDCVEGYVPNLEFNRESTN